MEEPLTSLIKWLEMKAAPVPMIDHNLLHEMYDQ